MNIRKARIEDYDKIIELYKELYDAEKIFDKNLSNIYNVSNKQKENILKRIKSRKEIFLVAEENNEIIGVVDGYIIDNNNHIEKVGYLDHLCVYKKYRKRGIGEKLIEEFTNKMRNKNVIYLKLNAFEKNLPATGLYKKLGFEEYSIYYMKKI